MTDEARAAIAASRAYLELVVRGPRSDEEFASFLDQCIPAAVAKT